MKKTLNALRLKICVLFTTPGFKSCTRLTYRFDHSLCMYVKTRRTIVVQNKCWHFKIKRSYQFLASILIINIIITRRRVYGFKIFLKKKSKFTKRLFSRKNVCMCVVRLRESLCRFVTATVHFEYKIRIRNDIPVEFKINKL